jgi:Protein of unknown function (DUF3987)/Bifunctional DNA primase/polymerase, N-terminal/Primase C terminal 1 (PriCT-1)
VIRADHQVTDAIVNAANNFAGTQLQTVQVEQAALSLAEEQGMPVFPCRPDKKPYTLHGLKDASKNIEQITRWWQQWPNALIGVPTGKASGLLVVDVDPIGADWYRQNAARLAPGRVHSSPRGHHLPYRMPKADVRNSAGKLAPGIDVRGEGGYIIWWPAHGHEAVGSLEELTDPPEWLLAQLTEAKPAAVVKLNGHAHNEGGRNDFLSREAYRLRKQGSTVEQILPVLQALNSARCVPPVSDAELQKIAAGKAQIEPEGPEPWPDPVNILQELSAPAFSGDELPSVLAEYPTAYARATGFDPGITLSAALAVAAAALSDGFQIVGDSQSKWFQQSRLWVLDIARPGAGKTPAQKAMLAPLWDIHTVSDSQWREAVKALSEDEPKPPRPRVILVDTTVEALSEALRENPRGLLIANDEFEGWLGGLDAYRRGAVSRDRGEWLRAFDGGPHTVERIQRGSVFVENWGVSILTATTPAVLAKLSRSLPEDGLLQRFIPIIGRSKLEAQPVEGLEQMRIRYIEIIRRLFHAQPRAHNGCVPLSFEAQAFLKAWLRQNQITQEASGTLEPALEAHFAKYPTFLLRITLAFHAANIVNLASEGARDPAAWPVPLSTIENAARFLKRASQHAVLLYWNRNGGSEAYELGQDIARAILAHGWTTVARRDLIQTVRAFRKATPELQDATLRLFVDIGWLRYAEGGYTKAVPARYVVNPLLPAKFAEVAERERERRAVIRDLIKQGVQDRRTDHA